MVNRNALEPGHTLHWYVIKEVLGQGGFGITYLALDTNLDQLVAIKEYLPTEFAVREQDDSVNPVSSDIDEHYQWGLDRFITEAKTLTKFKHHNLVRVLTVFTENNTAYMVMEYEKGQALHDILKERRTLSESELNGILTPLLDGLEKVHAEGFVHRDIKPANIYLREDGSPVLLDFGSARQAMGHHTRTLTTMVSPGFAPFEQYVSKSDKQGPWTDIYGLGATLYRAATGRSPTDAMDRSEALLHVGKDVFVSVSEIAPEGFSENFLSAVDHSLLFKPEQRPQTISEWQEDFKHGYKNKLQPESEQETEIVNLHEEKEQATEKIANTFQNDATIKKEQTENIEADIKKPSFFKRLLGKIKKIIKWAAILFGVLVLLSLCKDKNKTDDEKIETDTAKDVSTLSEESTQDQATDLFPSDVKVPVTDVFHEQDTDNRIDKLLEEAANDIQSLRLTTPDGNNAVEKYQQVLQLDPFNQQAKQGLTDVAGKYLGFMRNSLYKNDLPKAEHYFTKASSVDPFHPDLNDAQADLQAAQEAKEQEALANIEKIDKKEADKKITDTRDSPSLMTDDEKKNIERIKKRLEKNPKDRMAKRQLKRLASSIEKRIKKALDDGKFDLAETYLKEALDIAPNNKELQKALKDVTKLKWEMGQ